MNKAEIILDYIWVKRRQKYQRYNIPITTIYVGQEQWFTLVDVAGRISSVQMLGPDEMSVFDVPVIRVYKKSHIGVS